MSKISIIICEKCGASRIPRVEKPIKCPRCGHAPGTQIRTQKTTPPACKQDGVANNLYEGELS